MDSRLPFPKAQLRLNWDCREIADWKQRMNRPCRAVKTFLSRCRPIENGRPIGRPFRNFRCRMPFLEVCFLSEAERRVAEAGQGLLLK